MKTKTAAATIAALALCVHSQSQAGSIIYGGGTIGDDSSSTDGNGLITAGGSNALPGWNWPGDNGTPSFLYASDGKSGFQQLRAIVGAIPQSGALNGCD